MSTNEEQKAKEAAFGIIVEEILTSRLPEELKLEADALLNGTSERNGASPTLVDAMVNLGEEAGITAASIDDITTFTSMDEISAIATSFTKPEEEQRKDLFIDAATGILSEEQGNELMAAILTQQIELTGEYVGELTSQIGEGGFAESLRPQEDTSITPPKPWSRE